MGAAADIISWLTIGVGIVGILASGVAGVSIRGRPKLAGVSLLLIVVSLFLGPILSDDPGQQLLSIISHVAVLSGAAWIGWRLIRDERTAKRSRNVQV